MRHESATRNLIARFPSQLPAMIGPISGPYSPTGTAKASKSAVRIMESPRRSPSPSSMYFLEDPIELSRAALFALDLLGQICLVELGDRTDALWPFPFRNRLSGNALALLDIDKQIPRLLTRRGDPMLREIS